MNAYKTEVVLSEEGQLSLRDLPFRAGETVEVIVLELAKNGAATKNGSTTKSVEDDAMYHIEELIAGLPDSEGAPINFAKNHDRYIHGRSIDGQ